MELNNIKNKGENGQKSEEEDKDDIFDKIVGKTGKWQIFISLLVFLVKLGVAWHQLGIIFLAPPASFHCKDSDYGENECVANCTSYVFNKTTFQNTIIMNFDLVCDREWLKDFTQTIFMFGVLVGNMVFGIISDRYGRKWSLISAVVLQAIIGSLTVFSEDIYTFTILRFFVALATGGTMVTSFVIIMELFGASYRYQMGILYQLPFVIGHMSLGGIGYLSSDNWKHYQLYVSVPSFLLIVYYWCVPESPRWLLAKGDIHEASVIMKKGAQVNNKPTDDIDAQLKTYKKGSDENKESVIKLFTMSKWRWMTLNISYVWFACALCFFGVSQYVGQLGGDIFTNVTLSGAIALPGNAVAILFNSKFGRKITMVGSMALAGIPLLVSSFITGEILKVWLACIALFGMSVAFPTAYIFAGELFPTTVRNSGVGTCAFISRIGSMIAPFVAGLVTYNPWMPTVIFSVIPLTSILAIIALPETHGKRLTDSVH